MCTQRNPALDHSLWSSYFPKRHPVALSERLCKHRVVTKRFFPQTARREDLRAVVLACPFILICSLGRGCSKASSLFTKWRKQYLPVGWAEGIKSCLGSGPKMSAGLNGKWNVCIKDHLEFCWCQHWKRRGSWGRQWSSPGARAGRAEVRSRPGLSILQTVSEGEGMKRPFRPLNIFQLEKLPLRGKRVLLAMLLKHPGWNRGCVMSNTALRHARVAMREEEKEAEWETPFPSPPHAEEMVLQAGEKHKS